MPLHVQIDTTGTIIGTGVVFARMCGNSVQHGSDLFDCLTFSGPDPITSWQDLCDWNGGVLRVGVKSLPELELIGDLIQVKNRTSYLLNLNPGRGFNPVTNGAGSPDTNPASSAGDLDPASLNDVYQLLVERAEILDSALDQRTQEISEINRTDPLTGCRNRQYLEQLVASGSSYQRVAAIFIDIDDFGYINERYGHLFGDQTLTNTARLLMDRFQDLNDAKTHCEVVRFGGDEFLIVMLTNHSEDWANRTAQLRLRKVEQLLNLGDQSGVTGHSLQLTAGFFIEDIKKHGMPDLIVDVTTAMRMLKSGHRGQTVNLDRHDHVSITHQRTINRDFHGDLAAGAITLAYQPIVDCKTLSIRGFEALARWNHRVMGNVEPENFIHLMEAGPECENATKIQMDKLLRDVSEMTRAGRMTPDMYASFNLSSSQLLLPNLVEIFMSGLKRHGVSPGAVQIEVTENIQLNILTTISEVLTELRHLGFLIALDDFGTGFSAMNVALRLPIHKLKIDRSLTDNSLIQHDGKIILGSMVRMCRELGIDTVAEGIETRRQITIAQEVGCNELQGFWFGHPQPFDPDDPSATGWTELGEGAPAKTALV